MNDNDIELLLGFASHIEDHRHDKPETFSASIYLSNVSNPEKYEAMNPDNGWGSYKSLCEKWRKIISRAKEIVDVVPDATWWEWS